MEDFRRFQLASHPFQGLLYFAATGRSASRLRSLGVEGEIQVVGAPGLDAIIDRICPSREMVIQDLSLPRSRWDVVLYHPHPDNASRSAAEMEEVLSAAWELAEEDDSAVVVIFPNNDAGCGGILDRIQRRRADPRLRVFTSLERDGYLNLLSHARLLLGNSSSGIIESVSLGLPAVNIGSRQAGRERDANVIDAPPERLQIIAAARRAWTDPEVQKVLQSRKSLYGDGRASERIAAALLNEIGKK